MLRPYLWLLPRDYFLYSCLTKPVASISRTRLGSTKAARVCGSGPRIARGEIIERGLHAFRRRQQIIRIGRGVSLPGALETLLIGDLQVFSPNRFRLFFVGFVEMDCLDHGAGEFQK